MHAIGVLSETEFWATLDDVDRQIVGSAPEVEFFAFANWAGAVSLEEWLLPDGERITAVFENPSIGGAARVTAFSLRHFGLAEIRAAIPWGEPSRHLVTIDAQAVEFHAVRNHTEVRLLGTTSRSAILIEAPLDLAADIVLERVLDVQPYLAGRRKKIARARSGPRG